MIIAKQCIEKKQPGIEVCDRNKSAKFGLRKKYALICTSTYRVRFTTWLIDNAM